MSLQASWASVKFRSGCVFLVTRVTPMILHGPETISSAKESQSPSVGCCLCLSPRALLLGRASLSTRQLGLKFRNNRTQIRQVGARLDPCCVSHRVQVHPHLTEFRCLVHYMETLATSSWARASLGDAAAANLFGVYKMKGLRH